MSTAPQDVHTLVVGAGMSGLGYAAFTSADEVLVLEADSDVGGYCKTVCQDGFTWDYSGHFFHFKHAAIEGWLRERMPAEEVHTIARKACIWYGDRWIDFPFQKNIHQLPQDEFLVCLRDLIDRDDDATPPAHFEELLYRRFGRGIAERFLVPYNEKLYATSMRSLDVDAMGRFFPWAEARDIVRHFVEPAASGYNATFTYPRGGAIRYVEALLAEVPQERVRGDEPVIRIDVEQRIAETTKGRYRYRHLVSSAPFDRLLGLCGLRAPAGTLSANKVLVFNLGFDRKGPRDVHWMYFPQREICFYRIGFYDNIFDESRMSLYVEIGLAADDDPDPSASLAQVLEDLEGAGIVAGHKLVAHHHVVLDPAYVHLSSASMRYVGATRASLAKAGIHSIGRYGAWTYCSIEDNLVEALTLAAELDWLEGRPPHPLATALGRTPAQLALPEAP